MDSDPDPTAPESVEPLEAAAEARADRLVSIQERMREQLGRVLDAKDIP